MTTKKTNSSTAQSSFIKKLINDFWFTKHSDPDLANLQKNRWFYLYTFIFFEITLAVITFFATMCFGSFMSAIELGSMALFMYYAPILVGLLLAAVVAFVAIRFYAKKASDLWKSFILLKGQKKLSDPKYLRKIHSYYDKSNPEPALLNNTLANTVGELFEVVSTILTALIQFIPCLVILIMLSPMLPWLSLVICTSIMFICYNVAKIMNESQTRYLSEETQFITNGSYLTANVGYVMQANLTKYQSSIAEKNVGQSQHYREVYRGKKSIFDFFQVAAEKIIIYGPYIIFGYFAIINNIPMAVFTLMVTTFIQACTHLMRINEIHTSVVKIASTENVIGPYERLDGYEPLEITYTNGNSLALDVIGLNHEQKPQLYKIVDKEEGQVLPYNLTTHEYGSPTKLNLNNMYLFSKVVSPQKISDILRKDPNDCSGKAPKQQASNLLTNGSEVFLGSSYNPDFIYKHTFALGQRIWVRGASGLGKSLFLGMINGTNRLGLGNVTRPKTSECIFIPQIVCLNDTSSLRDQLLAELPEDERKQIPDRVLIDMIKQYMPSKFDSATPLKSSERQKDSICDAEKSILDQQSIGLSGGEKQKLVLIRLLLRKLNNSDEIKLITLDEPFSSCPRDEVKLIKAIYEKYTRATILLISHSDPKSEVGEALKELHTHELELKATADLAGNAYKTQARVSLDLTECQYNTTSEDKVTSHGIGNTSSIMSVSLYTERDTLLWRSEEKSLKTV